MMLPVFAPVTFGEESTRVRNLKTLYKKEFEVATRGIFDDPTTKSLPFPELAALFTVVRERGESIPHDLHQLSLRVVKESLAAPDLEKRRTFHDGIAMWEMVNRETYLNELRPWVADCIRRLGKTMDDTAMLDAFLAVSPAGGTRKGEDDQSSRVARQALFWLLSDRWMEREVKKLGRELAPRFRCPPFSGIVPKGIRDELNAEAVAAWTEAARFRAWSDVQRKTAAPGPASAAPQKREFADVGAPNFEGALDGFFKNSNALTREEIARFYWTSGGWCGTGGNDFHAVQSRVAMMIDLRERRLPQVIEGIMVEGTSAGGIPVAWEDANSWAFLLIEVCGLDWEKLFSSAMLPYRGQDDPALISCHRAEQLLATRGSTFAAKIVLAAHRRAIEMADRTTKSGTAAVQAGVPIRAFFNVDRLARFITPGDVPPGSQPEVAPEIQKELLDLVLASLSVDSDYVSLANLLPKLARLQRPEIKEAMRSLLASRFDYVVQNAARALWKMGEEHAPKMAHPGARFRIVLNGEEWAFDAETFPVIHYESRQDGWGINNFLTQSFGSNVRQLEFPHDGVIQALDGMIAARMTLRPKTVEFGEREKTTLAQPWFSVPLDLPIKPGINHVHATVCPLVVAVSYPQPSSAYEGKTVDLELTWLDEPGRERPVPSKFHEPVRERYTFEALQPGSYRLAITAPGSARREFGPIAVKEGMIPLVVPLGR